MSPGSQPTNVKPSRKFSSTYSILSSSGTKGVYMFSGLAVRSAGVLGPFASGASGVPRFGAMLRLFAKAVCEAALKGSCEAHQERHSKQLARIKTIGGD